MQHRWRCHGNKRTRLLRLFQDAHNPKSFSSNGRFFFPSDIWSAGLVSISFFCNSHSAIIFSAVVNGDIWSKNPALWVCVYHGCLYCNHYNFAPVSILANLILYGHFSGLYFYQSLWLLRCFFPTDNLTTWTSGASSNLESLTSTVLVQSELHLLFAHCFSKFKPADHGTRFIKPVGPPYFSLWEGLCGTPFHKYTSCSLMLSNIMFSSLKTPLKIRWLSILVRINTWV